MKSKVITTVLSFALSVIMLACIGIAPISAAALAGDANLDGMVTSTDARWALQAAVEARVLSAEQLAAADMDADGSITTSDARKILTLSLQPITLTSISINTLPTKQTYIAGDALDLTGAAINLNYDNGGHESVAITSAMVSGYNAAATGTQTITVTYQTFTTTFTVTVNAKEATSITMATAPAKVSYLQGEALDVTGATISVSYNNNTSETVTVTSAMVSGYNANTVGAQTLTVTYLGKTTTFGVTVTSSSPAIDAYGDGYNFNYLCGVDMFGRTFTPVTGFDASKQVGIFYFLWNGQHVVNSSADVYDISALIAAGKEKSDVLNAAGTALSPLGEYHYWGKPLFGYYKATETWAIRRHIELLTSAGIDFIVFDTTNGFTYDSVWGAILPVMLTMQNAGWNVPKIAFYTHKAGSTPSSAVMDSLYSSIYGNATNASKYASLFYTPNGKPMIIGDDPSATVSANMDVRPSYWPQEGMYGTITDAARAGFPWIEWVYPQYNHNGVVSVSVAQHPNGRFSDNPIQNYGKNNWGRGMDASGNRNADSFEQGQNFQRQWDSAKDLGASTVFLTGWNEWIVLKTADIGRATFVDGYNEEFSRDIEPMSGGYEDSFYLQMIQNIRDYKGISGNLASGVSKTIDVSVVSSIAQWDSVTNQYLNPQSVAYARAGSPVQGLKPAEDADLYTVKAPLNNITSVKVTHDADNVYFLINCSANVKNYTSTLVTNAVSQDRWMNVFLGIGAVSDQGWEGYNYVVNRSVSLATATAGAVGTGTVCQLNADGTTGSQVGTATVSYKGKYVQIAIPRSVIGATSTSGMYFKVADNVKNYTDINDYYITGKAFPMGRLSYYYYF